MRMKMTCLVALPRFIQQGAPSLMEGDLALSVSEKTQPNANEVAYHLGRRSSGSAGYLDLWEWFANEGQKWGEHGRHEGGMFGGLL